MYSLEEIQTINEKVQKEIDLVLIKYEPEIIEAIKRQVGKGHRVFTGMGSFHIENENGESIADNFCNKISPMIYRDYHETGFDLSELNGFKKII